MRKELFFSIMGAMLLLSIVVFVVRGGALREEPAGHSAGSAFTYQGRLEREGAVVDNTCDLRFRLWDAAAAGNQLGSDQVLAGVAIEEGLFTVLLNNGGEFGPQAFNGEARWLEVAVRCADDSGFTTLGRQELTAAPYAQYALAAPWDGLDGVPAGFADGTDDGLTSVSWEMILNRPAGLDDGDDDTTYTAGEGLTLSDTEFRAQGSPYANVVIVAKSGGDFTSIQEALDSIIDASADNRYLVWVAPGVYSEQVTMKPFVDLEGAGQNLTKITYTGATTWTQATVMGASDTELRSLTVENTGGSEYAMVVFNKGVSGRVRDLNLQSSGASSGNVGIWVEDSTYLIQNTTISASGSASNGIGVYGIGSRITISNVSCTTSATHWFSVCYFIGNGSGDLFNVTAESVGEFAATGLLIDNSHANAREVHLSASGGYGVNYGIIVDSSWFTGSQVIAEASTIFTGTKTNAPQAVQNSFLNFFPSLQRLESESVIDYYSIGLMGAFSSTVRVSNSALRATGGISSTGVGSIGISPDVIRLLNSDISGETNTVVTFYPESDIYVGGSQLAGGPIIGPGQVTCAGVYDEEFVFYPDTCPE